jgi:hypothetical protein
MNNEKKKIIQNKIVSAKHKLTSNAFNTLTGSDRVENFYCVRDP